jgi:hypothetical protein
MHQPRRAVDNHTRGERMAGEVVRGQAGLDHLKCRCPLIVGQQHRIIESGGLRGCVQAYLLEFSHAHAQSGWGSECQQQPFTLAGWKYLGIFDAESGIY